MKSRRVRLSDIAELTVGFVGNMAKQYKDEGVKFLRSLNIKPFSIVEDDLKYISREFNESLRKSILHENDLIIVRTGIPGTCCVVSKDYEGCNCADVVLVRPNLQVVNPHYLAAYINVWGKKQVENNKVGAIQKHFNVKSAEEMLIDLPDLESQNKVAKILCDLNDKIISNEKINDYLEEMAKTIYDYWFVQFDFPNENGKSYKSSGGALLYNEVLKKEIPFGWTIDTLGNLLSKVPNSTKIPAIDFYDKGSIPVIDQSSDFIAGYTDDETSVLYNKTGYIVFGDHTRVVKYICFPFARGADGTQIINSNTRCMPNELFYQVIKSIDLSNYGYARHFKYLKDTIIVIPSANLADIYAEKVGKWYENQVSIMKENNALSQLRDWLLPMLMNGQATIED
ncbi:restriction endonuclease subunit S [Roseburia inulinivorans]|jgi:type I restriction enzyme S subunit|nr:restriction endonuclease subunit S [Roseburia inulinivorans]MCC3343132.1 restriction endonuclease subunit S [Roseburia inulinivorans DSM 16841]